MTPRLVLGFLGFLIPYLSGSPAAYSNYEGMYVSGGAGLNLGEDMEMGGPEAELELGWVGLGALGYAFSGGIRFEGEFAYRRNAADGLNTGASLSGDMTAMSFMANIYYEYRRPDWVVAPYAGVGLGVLRAVPGNVGPVAGSSLDDSDLGIAAQGIAGVAFDITDRIAATAEYRHFRAPDLTFETRVGTKVDSDYAANQFMLGLRYRFGGTGPTRPPASATSAAPAPARAPQAVSTPAPKPQRPARTAKLTTVTKPEPANTVEKTAAVRSAPLPRPRKAPRAVSRPQQPAMRVYFASNSSYLNADGQRLIRAFADGARKNSDARILVTGYADGAGTPAYNKWLSQRRAERVKAVLTREGIDRRRISTVGGGEVRSGDAAANSTDRRTEIRYLGK